MTHDMSKTNNAVLQYLWP